MAFKAHDAEVSPACGEICFSHFVECEIRAHISIIDSESLRGSLSALASQDVANGFAGNGLRLAESLLLAEKHQERWWKSTSSAFLRERHNYKCLNTQATLNRRGWHAKCTADPDADRSLRARLLAPDGARASHDRSFDSRFGISCIKATEA
jgi:hypothetical protein